MTPADEATFIMLWQQGLSHDALAQQLGIPVGTVKSRAHTLQQRGLIQPRPRGGRQALVQPEKPAPVQRAVQSSAENPALHGAGAVHDSAVQTTMHGAVQVQNSAELQVPAAIADEFMRALEPLPQARAPGTYRGAGPGQGRRP